MRFHSVADACVATEDAQLSLFFLPESGRTGAVSRRLPLVGCAEDILCPLLLGTLRAGEDGPFFALRFYAKKLPRDRYKSGNSRW